MQNIIQSINDEFNNNKNVSREEKCVLINLDRFQVISGQKNFIIQQKKNFNSEIERLSTLYKHNYFKKKEWKQKHKEKENEIKNMIIKFEKDIKKYRERVINVNIGIN